MIVRYDFRSEHEIVSFRFVAEDDCCSDVRGGNLSDTMAVDIDGRVAILIIIVYKFLDPFFFFFFTFLHFFFFFPIFYLMGFRRRRRHRRRRQNI